MSKDPSVDNVVEELRKLAVGNKFDFTVKSPLTDVTFIFGGKKIHAGRDFLSIYSPHFKALFGRSEAGGFAHVYRMDERAYEDFLEMLKCLVDPSREVKANFVQPLFSMAEAFDIKYLMDRVEGSVLNLPEYTVASKFLLADRYRLIRLQVLCVIPRIYVDDDGDGQMVNRQTYWQVVWSNEYERFSEAGRKAFDQEEDLMQMSICKTLEEVENVEEPANGFLATGTIMLEYPGRSDLPPHFIQLAGLLWSVTCYKYHRGSLPLSVDYSPYLIMNQNRITSVEWSVEGFVEVSMVRMEKSTGKEEWRKEKKYAFSLHNHKRECKIGEWSEDLSENADKVVSMTAVFHVTSISNVRQGPSFDFTSPSDLSNVAFIVEGRKIHVNKQYLSMISPRFREIFNEKNEVDVKNVKYKDFIEFLHWIYPSSQKTSTVSLMFSLLRICDELGVDILKPEVADFLNHNRAAEIYPEISTIFFFEFDCGADNKEDLMDLFRDWFLHRTRNTVQVMRNRVEACDLLAKMTPEKKAAMYEWMIEKGDN